jgi:signal peptidase I
LVYDDFGPYTVPEDSYFLMGDNRPNSQDSRELGAFAKEKIVAKVFFRIKPFTWFN